MKRSLDIAIVAGSNPSPDYDTEPLWSSRICVVLPEDHMLAICETEDWMYLRGERFIVGLDPSSGRFPEVVVKRLGDDNGDIYRPAIESFPVCQETLFQLVALGIGVSLTSESSVVNSGSGVVIRSLMGDEDWIDYSAVWLPENDNPALRRFVSLARVKAVQQQNVRSSTSASKRA
jgi:DNA-binding transcriptional LysR family regulator